MKTFFKEATDAYLISDEGCAACDPVTIRAPTSQRQYLENRIKLAFAAGWNAAAQRYHSPESEEAKP